MPILINVYKYHVSSESRATLRAFQTQTADIQLAQPANNTNNSIRSTYKHAHTKMTINTNVVHKMANKLNHLLI